MASGYRRTNYQKGGSTTPPPPPDSQIKKLTYFLEFIIFLFINIFLNNINFTHYKYQDVNQ